MEQAPDALARLRGLDVGSHGYWHHTYRTARENHRNMLRGIEVLLAAGIEPSGFGIGRVQRDHRLARELLRRRVEGDDRVGHDRRLVAPAVDLPLHVEDRVLLD